MSGQSGTLTTTFWDDGTTPEFSWDTAQTKVTGGGGIPFLYGTMRVSMPVEQIIGMYLESDTQLQTLNLLYAICMGKLDSVSDIRINGDSLAEYPEIPEPIIRYGENYQAAVPAFASIKTDVSVGLALTTSWIERTTVAEVTGFGVGLSLPEGLYYKLPDGQTGATEVDIQMQYRKHGDVSWVTLYSTDSYPASTLGDRWSGGYWGKDPATGNAIWAEIEAGSSTPGDHAEGDPYTVDPYLWSRSAYPDDGTGIPIMIWHWVENATVIIPEGTEETQYIKLDTWMEFPVKRCDYRTGLPAARYDIRVKFMYQPPADSDGCTYYNAVNWEFIREIIEDGFRYPNVATFALSAVPTEKISGGLPSVDFLATRSTVYVFNPVTSAYEEKAATNPAWLCYDIIHQAMKFETSTPGVYEFSYYGEPHEKLDPYWTQWSGWAAWCDWDEAEPYIDKRPYACNFYFQSQGSLQDALDAAATIGRAVVRQVGECYKPIYEHPEPAIVQRFLFSHATIDKDSFSETYAISPDRANLVEVTYQDPDNDYKDETVLVPAEDYDTSQLDSKPASITLQGCCDRAMAAAFGRYKLNLNRYTPVTSKWVANIDAIHCELGDIVEAPAEFGGRLLSGCTATTLYLDGPVTIESGKTYHVIINHQDTDAREETAVLTGAGTVSILSVSAFSRAPAEDTRFVFGEVNQVARLRRIVSISCDSEFKRQIIAAEFNGAVFADAIDIPVYPFNPYRGRTRPPALESVSLELVWKLDQIAKIWNPYIKGTLNIDMAFDYASLKTPVVKGVIYAQANPGDTHLYPMSSKKYGLSFDQTAALFEVEAAGYNGMTIYMTAVLVNALGVESAKCLPAVLYVNTSYVPAPSTSNVSIDSYDYVNNGPSGYIVYFSWVPYGWALVGGKYAPILDWNNGSNYYVFKSYLVVYGYVAESGNIPEPTQMHWMESADIGNIFDASGSIITDADALDSICRAAASAGLKLEYSQQWLAITAFPIMKNGSAGVVDTTQFDYGLDWEWIQVKWPGGTNNNITDNQIQNAELVYTMQPGSVFLNEMNWDYALQSPYIDGFCIVFRAQPYQWSWILDGAVSDTETDISNIIAAIDPATGGGAAAANDFVARYAEWAATGISRFYMTFVNDTSWEIIQIDVQTLAVTRGVEGTTAHAWSAGAIWSYTPCEQIDTIALIYDTTSRAYTFNPPIQIGGALHCTIFAIKLMTEVPGYVRSYYALWDTVRNR